MGLGSSLCLFKLSAPVLSNCCPVGTKGPTHHTKSALRYEMPHFIIRGSSTWLSDFCLCQAVSKLSMFLAFGISHTASLPPHSASHHHHHLVRDAQPERRRPINSPSAAISRQRRASGKVCKWNDEATQPDTGDTLISPDSFLQTRQDVDCMSETGISVLISDAVLHEHSQPPSSGLAGSNKRLVARHCSPRTGKIRLTTSRGIRLSSPAA